MKKFLLLLCIVVIPGLMAAQTEMGRINVSDWVLFSTGSNKQIKKINDTTMYAYYRSGPDKSGIKIFDKKMNIIRDIPLELTKNKKVIFTRRAYAEFISFPYTFYRPDIRAVVIVGYTKNDRKDFSVVGITYSIDGAGLLDVQELANTSSDNFLIRYSNNEAYFVIAELLKKNTEKGYKVKYDVFNTECTKVLSTEGDLIRHTDNYYRILDNGELILFNIKERGREMTYQFTRVDKFGNKSTAVYAPPKSSKEYYNGFSIIQSAAGEYFATSIKYKTKADGFAILKIDFDNNTVKKITEKTFDKTAFAKLNSIRTKSVRMVDKKLKPIRKFTTYSIYNTSADEDNIYIILQNSYVKVKRSRYNTTYTYVQEGLIVGCYNNIGDEQWITPIRSLAKQIEGDMNSINGNGLSVAPSLYETPDDICLLLRSQNKTFYTRIDKATGKDIEPVLILDDEKTATNANCFGWFDDDEFIVLSMKGLSLWKKNDFWLKSIKINDKPEI